MTGVTVQRGSASVSHEAPREGQADFDRAYRTERRAIERHLVYLTGDRQVAEDLTQEAFGRLYEALSAEESTEIRNARAWLRTVASNLAYNHLRGERRRVTRETVAETTGETDVDAVLDVRRALGDLEARDRIVLMLRHSGFTYAEIAEAVDIAPSSVGTILARSQRRFREIYEGTESGAHREE